MDTQQTPQGESGLNTGRLAGATTNTAIFGIQHERRHMLVHRDTANAATKPMTPDEHFKIVCKTGSNKIMKQHAVGCEFIHIEENGGQLTI